MGRGGKMLMQWMLNALSVCLEAEHMAVCGNTEVSGL